jgi:glycosyltransferase involved in cell wall biosynthesis
MARVDLSILIPARSEMFLANTVQNILENIQGNTEIIVVCDGNWPEPPIEDNPRVTLIYHSESIGQRAATNEAAKYSRSKFIMKADAHCKFDKGFDVKLMADCEYDWTIVPRMYNLHAFDWVCNKCGDRRYQGPTPTSCPKCDNKTDFRRDILWKEKHNPTSDFFRFDRELHFQYWREFKDRQEAKGNLAPTMSLLGACWFMHRQRYWDLGGSDEAHGSWGQMGTEIGCKSWLSGGQLLVNKKTWFAHMFRTQGFDFGFPYPNPGIKQARQRSRDLWYGNQWPKAKYSLSWLIKKFAPVPDWEQLPEDKPRVIPPVHHDGPTKGMLYYTDNQLDESILRVVQKHLNYCCNGYRLVSVSLKPIPFGENHVLPLDRGYLTMNKQQLAGLEALDTDIVFMTEHDIIYPKCHFDFTPPRKDVFYYNLNWWKVRTTDGQALHFKAKQVSGLCAYRDILIEYFRNRVKKIESGEIGGRRHFEPGSGHHRDGYKDLTTHGHDVWMSEVPYVDIRHQKVMTRNIFDPSGYRGQVVDWQLADEIPGGWGKTKGRFNQWLKEVENKYA